jgi:broad specificity phosphatase PhoE
MARLKLVLARHGERTANSARVFANRSDKFGLTTLGLVEVTSLAQCLQHRCQSIGLVYTSPLCRAVETARIVAEYFDIPWAPHPGLVEFDVGILEGRADQSSW